MFFTIATQNFLTYKNFQQTLTHNIIKLYFLGCYCQYNYYAIVTVQCKHYIIVTVQCKHYIIVTV